MTSWRIRKISDHSEVQEVTGETLHAMLQARIVGEHEEFQPPGQEAWLFAPETLWRLQFGSSAPAKQASDGVAPAPAQRVLEGRAPPAAAPRVPPSPKKMPRASADDRRAFASPLARDGGPTTAGRMRAERHWPGDDDSEEMTPLIDLTFLLLIFFMVASTVSAVASLELPHAQVGDTEDPRQRVVLVLDFRDVLSDADRDRLTGAKPVLLKDAKVFLASKPGALIAPQDLEGALTAAFVDKPEAQFVLQAHRKMPLGVVREVLKVAKQAGARETLVGVTMPR